MKGESRPLSERLSDGLIPVPESGCHLWTGQMNDKGYGRIVIEGRQCMAHRVAWEVSVGPIPNGSFVLHKCDTPSCCNVGHLFLGTHRENIADKMFKRRHSKLTLAQVEAIRACTLNSPQTAALFGIKDCHVRNIRTGRAWGKEMCDRARDLEEKAARISDSTVI